MNDFDQQLEGLLKQAALQYIIYQHNGDTERMDKTSLLHGNYSKKSMLLDLQAISQQESRV